jgi:hypothetical protein
LGKLQAVVVEPSWRYLTVLLTRETGVNLRNRISHGLIDEVRREEAVLLIHVCFHLAGFRIEIKPDIAEGDQERV